MIRYYKYLVKYHSKNSRSKLFIPPIDEQKRYVLLSVYSWIVGMLPIMMIVKRRSDFLLNSPRSFLITIVSFQNTKYSILRPFPVFRNLWTPSISMSFMTLCFTPMQHGFITRSLFLSLILQRCPTLYTLALLRVRI